MLIVGTTDPVHVPAKSANCGKHLTDFQRLQQLRSVDGENVTLLMFVHVGKNSTNSTNINEGHKDYTSVPLLGLLRHRRGNFDVLTNCIQRFVMLLAIEELMK